MILDWLEEWFRGILTDGIIGNLTGLFDTVNQKVGEIAGEVGATPQGWNAGIFNMIRSLSETVIIPIAGAILAFVMCYELIQMVTEKNNMHDIDTFMFFKWVFKSFAAVLIVTNTWNIVMGIFDMAQQVVNQSAGVIISDTSIDLASVVTDLEAQLEAMSLGGLIGLWFQSLFVGLTMNILSICIMLVIYGRMIQIYLVTSLGPIPLSTMANSEWRSVGQNYLKSLLALAFQAFLCCAGIFGKRYCLPTGSCARILCASMTHAKNVNCAASHSTPAAIVPNTATPAQYWRRGGWLVNASAVNAKETQKQSCKSRFRG